MDYLIPKKLRLFVKIFEVLGISPSENKRYLIGFTINLVVIVTLLYFINRDSLLYSQNDFGFVDEFNDAFQLIVTYATVLSLLLETIHRRSAFKEFFEIATRLDLTFRDLRLEPEVYYNRLFVRYGRESLVLLLGTIALEIFIIINIDSDHDWRLYWIVNILPLMLNRFRHLQYSFHLRIIAVQMEMIAIVLEKLECIHEKPPKLVTNNKRIIYGIHRRLKLLRTAYNLIQEGIKTFNNMFSYSLVINLFQNFIELLSGSYWLYFYALKNELVISGKFISYMIFV